MRLVCGVLGANGWPTIALLSYYLRIFAMYLCMLAKHWPTLSFLCYLGFSGHSCMLTSINLSLAFLRVASVWSGLRSYTVRCHLQIYLDAFLSVTLSFLPSFLAQTVNLLLPTLSSQPGFNPFTRLYLTCLHFCPSLTMLLSFHFPTSSPMVLHLTLFALLFVGSFTLPPEEIYWGDNIPRQVD